MPTPATNPIPEGFSTATPYLNCSNAAEAIEFYKNAFGAVELMRLPAPDGRIMHACIRIGNSPIMLGDEFPEHGVLGPLALKGSPVSIHLCVADVDAVVAQAVAAGAKVTMPVDDAFWGDRYGQLKDPYGHRWSVATRKYDLTPEEISKAMLESMSNV